MKIHFGVLVVVALFVVALPLKAVPLEITEPARAPFDDPAIGPRNSGPRGSNLSQLANVAAVRLRAPDAFRANRRG